jgi:hypothetical protein
VLVASGKILKSLEFAENRREKPKEETKEEAKLTEKERGADCFSELSIFLFSFSRERFKSGLRSRDLDESLCAETSDPT